MRKVCVITGSRADYGLLRWVIQGIQDSSKLELQLVTTGMHLSPEFGLTWREIEEDGFHIDRRVETLLSSDTPDGIAKSMGLGMIGFSGTFAELRPDLVLLLGDRSEIFAAAVAASVMCVPIAHLHGGEITRGAIDDVLRHSITKLSHLHFVATEEYRQRVIQLGENADNVFLVGGLGLDSILNLTLLTREQLEDSLSLKFSERNLLVTFHPETLRPGHAASQMAELLAALEELDETTLIFTMPNSDAEGRSLSRMIEKFTADHPNSYSYTSLGHLRYLSCLKYVDGVVGNSSSGLLEAPSFKVGTVNIGDRQGGRIKAESILSCEPERTSIAEAISYLYSREFQEVLSSVQNPFGNGGASRAVVEILESIQLENLIMKTFVDSPPDWFRT